MKNNKHSLNTVEELMQKLNKENENEYYFRFLEEGDYNKNFFELLGQLTVAEKPSYEDYVTRFREMQKLNNKIIVVEGLDQNKIAGTITCSIELKFIRNLGSICHIEDFVVDKDHRNKKLGSKLLDLAITCAKFAGCYKVLLDAKDDVVPFYEKMGFNKTSNGMTIYFD